MSVRRSTHSAPPRGAAREDGAHVPSLLILCLFLAVRIVQALCTSQTLYQPDEFWQAPEIAHRLAFGYGYRTWEWTSTPPIRSIVHPATFVPLYTLLRWTGAHRCNAVLTIAPGVQQALVSAVGDWYSARLAYRVGGADVARFFCVVHLASFYLGYTSTRPLSNNLEASLCSAALFYWPLVASQVARVRSDAIGRGAFQKALVAAFLTVLIRPTSLVLWVFLSAKALRDVYAAPKTGGTASRAAAAVGLAVDAAVVGCVAVQVRQLTPSTPILACGALLDSLYFKTLVFVPFTFFMENVVRSVSVFYGSHPWHWYVTQGVPFLCTVMLPCVGLGWYKILRCRLGVGVRDAGSLRTLALAALWQVTVFSMLGHKEFRFLQAIVPLMHLFASVSLAEYASGHARVAEPKSLVSTFCSFPPAIRFLVLAQIPFTIYASVYHGRGAVRVMSQLHQDTASGRVSSVALLVPCHSTPWQSHLHSPQLEVATPERVNTSGDFGRAWFIACPPPSREDELDRYWEQSDFFYHDPLAYIDGRFPKHVDTTFPASPEASPLKKGSSPAPVKHRGYDLGWQHAWPSHLVVFDALLHVKARGCTGPACETVGGKLHSMGYRELHRLWNSLFEVDARKRGDVVVLEHESIAHSL